MATHKSAAGSFKPNHSEYRNTLKGKQIPKDTLTNLNQIYSENQLAPKLDPINQLKLNEQMTLLNDSCIDNLQ